MFKMQISIHLIICSIALYQICLCTPILGSRESREEQSCHMRELDLCMAPLAILGQGHNHAINNAEINRQCKILLETESCLHNLTSRCMTDNQAQLIYLLADNGLDSIRELCKAHSPLREKYLKHGNCINEQFKYQKICMRDFQASIEKANDIVWQDRLRLACCAFNKLNACTRDVLEPKCGVEAYELHKSLFRNAFSRLPSITCSKYEHSSKACGSLLPSAGTHPKGSKSHSALSRIMSAYTGNR